METLKLKTAIKVLGKQVKELTYNADEITAEDYSEAFAMRCESGRAVTTVQEVDPVFAMYLGFMAIRAVNQDIDIEDLKRIKGGDLVKVSNIGRNFILASIADETEGDEVQASED